ncbi:uncharacterized protein BDV17DRAFT_82190 [Aspergillus undulatus]|uniref:uncharacterized protein n=1 Tax=Aspergillus undulatus TaxID=1810928 RepID=UPI003CCD63D7
MTLMRRIRPGVSCRSFLVYHAWIEFHLLLVLATQVDFDPLLFHTAPILITEVDGLLPDRHGGSDGSLVALFLQLGNFLIFISFRISPRHSHCFFSTDTSTFARRTPWKELHLSHLIGAIS